LRLSEAIKNLHGKYKNDLTGDVSKSFPALSQVDPDAFAISIATVEGDVINVGQADQSFSIQSISKPFSYGLALEQHGHLFVEKKVGMEPTGEDFDSIIKLDDQNRPFNPMVNSGAIVTSGLIDAKNYATKKEELLQYFSAFAGQPLGIDDEVYQSEANNAHKNFAISYLLRHFKVMTSDFREDLDLYFNQCSVSVNTDSLAMMGATLANKGINPLTQKRCISHENLRHVLSIIFTCGMYNYSGEWAFDVGLPAKSGISGAILLIVPGLAGIAIYSPRLDKRGNSVRGIKVCEELSEQFKFHIFDYQTPKEISKIL